MKTQAVFFAFLMFAFGVSSCLATSIQVMDPGYQVELFASYHANSYTSNMLSDSAGNLYVVNRNRGSISKIDPIGNVTVDWSSGYGYSFDIVETAGTAYGSDFVVSDRDTDKLYKVDNNGNKTEFTTLSTPLCMALDTKGAYQSSLYAVSNSYDRIYSVSTSGQLSLFTSYNVSGWFDGLEFDPGTRFGGGLFLGIQQPSSGGIGGIYSIGTTGNIAAFPSDLVSSYAIQFDQEGGFFGGDMFARGKVSTTGSTDIFRIGPGGTTTSFLQGVGTAVGSGFCFGADGALYSAIGNMTTTGDVNVYRITPIPEPGTLLLLGTGAMLLRKRRN